jgi:hypothetical protein
VIGYYAAWCDSFAVVEMTLLDHLAMDWSTPEMKYCLGAQARGIKFVYQPACCVECEFVSPIHDHLFSFSFFYFFFTKKIFTIKQLPLFKYLYFLFFLDSLHLHHIVVCSSNKT